MLFRNVDSRLHWRYYSPLKYIMIAVNCRENVKPCNPWHRFPYMSTDRCDLSHSTPSSPTLCFRLWWLRYLPVSSLDGSTSRSALPPKCCPGKSAAVRSLIGPHYELFQPDSSESIRWKVSVLLPCLCSIIATRTKTVRCFPLRWC
jgi:hypothetical protein